MQKAKLPGEKRKLYEDAFCHQLEGFFEYLTKIQSLVLFVTLFIALYTILSIQGIPQNLEFTANATLNYILFFMWCAYFFMICLWFFGGKYKYRDNFIIAGFLGVFGVTLAGASLWLFIFHSGEITSPVIQQLLVYWPMAIFSFVFLFNSAKMMIQVESAVRKKY